LAIFLQNYEAWKDTLPIDKGGPHNKKLPKISIQGFCFSKGVSKEEFSQLSKTPSAKSG